MNRQLRLRDGKIKTAYWSLVGVVAALLVSTQAVFAADMWDRFSMIMKDIYGELVAISTIVAVTVAAIALLVRMISRNQRAVDEATSWLKRIVITWIVLNSLGFIVAYKTFEKYAEDYRGYEYNEEEKGYGFNCNPNAMWDWYQIGGRWPVTFLVKADCTEYSFGERSWGNYSKKYPAPEGYMWVSAARKKDICWDVMKNWYTARDTERYNKLKEAFQTGKLPDGYYGKIQENGIFYCGECAYAADETLDEYLARVGMPKSWKYPIGVSDIVDADDWLSKNDISIGKESSNWHEQIDTYIDDLDGEDVLVSVDYHM